jgi:N-acetylmuramoyl-L-alanine amidase
MEWVLAALAIFVLSAAALMVTAQAGVPASEPSPVALPTASPTPHPTATPTPEPAVNFSSVGAVATNGPVAVLQRPEPGAPVVRWLRSKTLLPVYHSAGPYLRVITPCEAEGWIAAKALTVFKRAEGPPHSLADATIVLDPGHGGMQTGAVGPSGLAEKDANLAIAWRMVGHLKGTRLFLTRYGDQTTGIRYRASLANALHAHALVSIHNNSVPDGPSDHPGTETWHQNRSSVANHLSGLLWSEVVRGLKTFKVGWVGDRKAGTRTRLNAHGHDYYGLLRASRSPTVIVEAMFISNAPEEALLRTTEGQDAVAKSIARGLKQYVESAGAEITQPYPGAVGSAGGVPAGCVDP